jgi:hypothetical protein
MGFIIGTAFRSDSGTLRFARPLGKRARKTHWPLLQAASLNFQVCSASQSIPISLADGRRFKMKPEQQGSLRSSTTCLCLIGEVNGSRRMIHCRAMMLLIP